MLWCTNRAKQFLLVHKSLRRDRDLETETPRCRQLPKLKSRNPPSAYRRFRIDVWRLRPHEQIPGNQGRPKRLRAEARNRPKGERHAELRLLELHDARIVNPALGNGPKRVIVVLRRHVDLVRRTRRDIGSRDE